MCLNIYLLSSKLTLVTTTLPFLRLTLIRYSFPRKMLELIRLLQTFAINEWN